MNKHFFGILLVFVFLLISCSANPEEQGAVTTGIHWGEIRRIHFESEWVDDRYIDIFLPEGYNADQSYPVLYMQDGQLLFDGYTTQNKQNWQMIDVIRELVAEGDFPSPIVVGIHNNGEKRFAEYFPTGVLSFVPDDIRDEMLAKLPAEPLGDDYLQFLVSELKPFLDENFSTRQGPRNTFVAGANMGALISLYALCEYPSVFSAAVCLSTHWLGPEPEDDILPNAYADYLRTNLPGPMRHRIYFDLGDQGPDVYYHPFQEFVDRILLFRGYVHGDDWITIYGSGDDYTEEALDKRIGSALRFLLRDR